MFWPIAITWLGLCAAGVLALNAKPKSFALISMLLAAFTAVIALWRVGPGGDEGFTTQLSITQALYALIVIWVLQLFNLIHVFWYWSRNGSRLVPRYLRAPETIGENEVYEHRVDHYLVRVTRISADRIGYQRFDRYQYEELAAHRFKELFARPARS